MPPLLFTLRDTARNLNDVGSRRRGRGPLVAKMPLPGGPFLRVYGVTKDSAGVALGDCVVQLFTTFDDAIVQERMSDASGNYEFNVGLGRVYYVVAYKAGAPDVAGTTVNTLVASA